MRPSPALLFAACVLAVPAWAEQKTGGTIILSDPAQGRTLGKVDGETVVLQNTPTGTVGKLGKDKVLLLKDSQGNTLGKVGDRRLFCHTDPASGVTLCK
ncbi:MAG: hypothetical protein NVV74_13780 [Magnetospirillum sp.]|nr:hypothetical protein [Magnetospirillum sp.]